MRVCSYYCFFEKEMTELEIKHRLQFMCLFHGVFVDEFTFKNLRIDAIIVDIKHRWIRGFEIKTSRSDFLSDKKWTQYTSFLSSLSIVCPAELIQKEEISKPFGLLWMSPEKTQWIKRPLNFQNRTSLAWLWIYVQVIEAELPRLRMENLNLNTEIYRLNKILQ